MKKFNYEEFRNKYEDEWKRGNITEESVEELFEIINTCSIDSVIADKIYWTITSLIELMIKYRFKKNQSYTLIEPIRMNNWSLHIWHSICPDCYDTIKLIYKSDHIESGVYEGFRLTYGNDCYVESAGDELINQLIEEFTVEKLCDIDYVENYLRTYAKTDKIRRYLQLI
jgi:hypothetical protein